jgi:hypothetical protein
MIMVPRTVFRVIRQLAHFGQWVAVALILIAPQSRADELPDENVDFSRQIRPILSSKCFSCHGPDQQQRKGDLRLDVAEGARHAIVPGDSKNSELIQRITAPDPDLRMPPKEAKTELSADEISLLEKWVTQGADYSVHWSFSKPQRSKTPAVDRGWGRNEIDAFVLKRLAEAELQPSSETDRVTLIRRLSLDLTGLPPRSEDVDRFVADIRPGAYERLVDRLLASQHYGERMSHDWLDLARYGDTNGYENDSDRQMWLYREWVINAFNANMPFDQFTREQIAGDLLPAASNSQKIASGFNRNTTYNEEGGADGEEFMVVYGVERASTTATVFLGLTLGCAQCHEHKYDPISQKEFYQFYAFFNSVDGEKGATGHDIPLPPLLSLPTKEQTANLNRTRQELAEVEARIKDELAKVTVVAVAAHEENEPKSSSAAECGEQESGTEKKTQKKTAQEPKEQPYFTTQVAWEMHEGNQEKSELPKEILELVTIDSQERNDEQQKRVRDYFFQHAYAATRSTFEPFNKQLAELKQRADEIEQSIPTTMVMKEMAERRPAFLLIRGDFQQEDEQVEPNVPLIFPPLGADQPRNRLGLAHWLTDKDNPLVARVAVNRLWKQLFGAGLVTTMEDFGVRGEYPSHPELLDWLATEFLRKDWDVKGLQRRIVMSATYRQSSRFRPEATKVDPYNRLLARQNRFRLTAEEIRDTALAVSGLLNNQLGGRSVSPYQPEGYYSDKGRWKWNQSKGEDLYRRGLYTFWRRTTTYPTFSIFDAPSRETCTVERPRTNTPLQALVTLNDPMFVEAARVFAERILREGGDSIDEKVRFAFRASLARDPDKHDRAIVVKIYADQFAKYSADAEAAAALIEQGEYPSPSHLNPAELAAWTTTANVLLNLDETITRE